MVESGWIEWCLCATWHWVGPLWGYISGGSVGCWGVFSVAFSTGAFHTLPSAGLPGLPQARRLGSERKGSQKTGLRQVPVKPPRVSCLPRPQC